MNSLMTIHPYKDNGIWMFDDESVGLKREALVAGVPEILEELCSAKGIEGYLNPTRGFTLIFSGVPFPGHDLEAKWVREGDGGNWYKVNLGSSEMEGWLCPALFKYFNEAPKSLYIQALQKPWSIPSPPWYDYDRYNDEQFDEVTKEEFKAMPKRWIAIHSNECETDDWHFVPKTYFNNHGHLPDTSISPYVPGFCETQEWTFEGPDISVEDTKQMLLDMGFEEVILNYEW